MLQPIETEGLFAGYIFTPRFQPHWDGWYNWITNCLTQFITHQNRILRFSSPEFQRNFPLQLTFPRLLLHFLCVLMAASGKKNKNISAMYDMPVLLLVTCWWMSLLVALVSNGWTIGNLGPFPVNTTPHKNAAWSFQRSSNLLHQNLPLVI